MGIYQQNPFIQVFLSSCMKKKYAKKRDQNKATAKEHMASLLKQAEEIFNKNKTLANRYVKLAREIAMKFKCRFTSEQRRKFCKHCYSFLMPNKNCRVRTRDGMLIHYCLECKNYNRYKYK